MVAIYYLSQGIGKKKKDGSPLYIVNVLCVDRWGKLAGCPLFLPTAEDYNRILDMNINPGSAVEIKTTWQGAFLDLVLDSRFEPLHFDVPAKETIHK